MSVAGFPDLGATERNLVLNADIVVGAQRMLATLPEQPGQERRGWPSPLLPALEGLLAELQGRTAVVLASGDPMVSGIGTTLIRVLGAEQVRVHPAVSSTALARARMGWSAESSDVVSLVSAPVDTLRRWLTPGARLVVLSAGAQTPAAVANTLVDACWPDAVVTVLGRLGADDESRVDAPAGGWGDRESPALNVVCVALGSAATSCDPTTALTWGTGPGLPDEAFGNDGQLTKWELRIAALAGLRPWPGELLWDLGAGAGSVGIEWARSHPRCRTIAVERDPQRAEQIRANAANLGVPGQVEVVLGASAAQLAELPDPGAVFIGGGASTDLIDAAWRRLPVGGRLVAHAVTLQTEQVLVAAFERYGGQLRRFAVERAEPLGARLSSWTPARPIVHWGVVKGRASE